MLQIKNTLGGGKPEGLYVWKKCDIGSELKEINESVSTLLYRFYNGSAVVLNGEIHILGGSSSKTSHYKWNGSSWTSVSTLPYNFYHGSAVVLNGEIHILGGYDTGAGLNHYKWNGSSWTSVSTLPYNFYHGSAVVLNGEIHILGGNFDEVKHYKFNGSSWVSVSTLPYYFSESCAVVLNGEIHILGTSYDYTGYSNHYKWDGLSWTSVTTLPYGFYGGSAVVFENKIHILGSAANSAYYKYHYIFNGASWTPVSALPYDFYSSVSVIYNNAIHILGSGNSSYYTAHYSVFRYVPVYTFLDYIVSDKETAYPDGGEKNGYWYERVTDILGLLGCTKISVETFIPTSNISVGYGTYTLNHGLGEIPKYAILLSEGATASNTLTRMLWMYIGRSSDYQTSMYEYLDSSGMTSLGVYRGSKSQDSTSTYITIGTDGSGQKLMAGVEYTLITMA